MLPDEARKAVETIECWAFRSDEAVTDADEWQTIKAHLLAREAEVERLQAIERERWDVVATRNAAVMRAERADALLRDIADCAWFEREAPATVELITAHLSENSRG